MPLPYNPEGLTKKLHEEVNPGLVHEEAYLEDTLAEAVSTALDFFGDEVGKVLVITGSPSDLKIVQEGLEPVLLNGFVPYVIACASAHRSPMIVDAIVEAAINSGVTHIIAAAGLKNALGDHICAKFGTRVSVCSVALSGEKLAPQAIASITSLPGSLPMVAASGVDKHGLKNAGLNALQAIGKDNLLVQAGFERQMLEQSIAPTRKVLVDEFGIDPENLKLPNHEILMQSELLVPFELVRRGKVRDIWKVGVNGKNYIVMIATDRISAFDVVQQIGFPGKGLALSGVAKALKEEAKGAIEGLKIDTVSGNTNDEILSDWPKGLIEALQVYEGRFEIVEECIPLDVEFIMRKRLLGSMWKSYVKARENQEVSRADEVVKLEEFGIELPANLNEKDEIPGGPIFTPSTKAHKGHDMNVDQETAKEIITKQVKEMGIVEESEGETFEKAKDLSIRLFKWINDFYADLGIDFCDTKFEFGLKKIDENEYELILIDEIGTSDSSRFIPDLSKQVFRKWLEDRGYDKETPWLLSGNIIVKMAGIYRKLWEQVINKLEK